MEWQSIAMGILPSLGVGALFFVAMRGIIRADRRERAEVAAYEAEQARRARAATEAKSEG